MNFIAFFNANKIKHFLLTYSFHPDLFLINERDCVNKKQLPTVLFTFH